MPAIARSAGVRRPRYMRKEMEAGRAREIRKAVEGVEEQLKSEFADSVAQLWSW